MEKQILDGILRLRQAQAQDDTTGCHAERMRSIPSYTVIALGAGFSGELPKNSRVIWLRRESDRKGRIFLDRPSLGSNQLEGYQRRFAKREQRYAQLASEVITIPEGSYANEAALKLLFAEVKNCGGFLTVLPEQVRDKEKFLTWLQSRLQFGFAAFELRNDLLSLEEINFCLQHIPQEKVLLSFRSKNSPALIFAKDYQIDWDIDLGVCPVAKPFILSSHQRFSDEATKVAVQVNSFAELLAGHKWQQEDPARRSFLPMSPNGRWNWYRLLMKNRMPVNFMREASGSAADQPTLCEWLSVPEKSEKFYAVLGDPIEHSFSPSFHREFFAKLGLPTFAIRVAREEWDEALQILQELGLRFASVTSPLKQQVGGNTLFFDEAHQVWKVSDTDTPALENTLIKELKKQQNQQEICIWGRGAMAQQLKKMLPTCQEAPSILVWAAGDTDNMPPEDWKPRQVFDLDYRLNSKGLQYAEKVAASYVSGLEFFEVQAKLQQQFWKDCHPESELVEDEGSKCVHVDSSFHSE